MRLVWDQIGDRLFESGVDRMVLYPRNTNNAYTPGVAWNGVTSVSENPDGAEPNDIYADNIKYVSIRSAETYGATIEAYTYPDEFAECDGSAEISTGIRIGQQSRKTFGYCYRSLIGSDQETDLSHGYKIHMVYNATVSPTEKTYETINDSPEAITFSWEVDTTPVSVTGYKPTACVELDSTKIDATKLAAFEDILYGTADTMPRLPLPDEIIEFFKEVAPEGAITLNVNPVAGTETVLDQLVSDLQTDVTIYDDYITGTLKYVSDFIGYSEDTALQAGNYIALNITTDPVSVRTVDVINGTEEVKTVGTDNVCVVRITDKTTQRIQIAASVDDATSTTKTYDLSQMTLEESAG